MCYRFAYGDTVKISKKYNIQLSNALLADVPKTEDVFPLNNAPIVYFDKEMSTYALESMRWGLVPFWAKELSVGKKLFNARIETVAEKPSFRESFIKYRCSIPIKRFYESSSVESQKQVYYFTNNEEMLSLAGLYSIIHTDDNQIHKTFTILTMPANSVVRVVHDRMPVVMNDELELTWLKEAPNTIILSKLSKYNSSLTLSRYEEGKHI